MGAEVVRLGDLLAHGRDHAFQVAHDQVGPVEDGGEMGEGVPPLGHRRAGEVVEHDVAHEEQSDLT